jgi:hypothetical protein
MHSLNVFYIQKKMNQNLKNMLIDILKISFLCAKSLPQRLPKVTVFINMHMTIVTFAIMSSNIGGNITENFNYLSERNKKPVFNNTMISMTET